MWQVLDDDRYHYTNTRPHPSRRRCTPAVAPWAKIKPVHPSRISLPVLDTWATLFGVSRWFGLVAMIRCKDAFLAGNPGLLEQPAPAFTSRLPQTLAKQVLGAGIFTEAPPDAHHNLMFLVPKDDIWARIIVWPKLLNFLGGKPPLSLAVKLRLHALIRSSVLLAEADGENWFYQFDLDPEIRPYFGCTIDADGHQHHQVLTVMCMGWCWSMAIAHTASVLLVLMATSLCHGLSGVAYADNFVLGIVSASVEQEASQVWEGVASHANARMKSTLDWIPRRQALGLILDAGNDLIGAPPERVRLLEDLVSHIHTMDHVWRWFGTVAYFLYHMDIPLFLFPGFMAWYRSQAQDMLVDGFWERDANLPDDARGVLNEMISWVSEPVPIMCDQSTPADVDIWTDASDEGGAWICGELSGATQWRAYDRIWRQEARALFGGVRASIALLGSGLTIDARQDNETVCSAWHRGNSRDPILAGILAELWWLLRRHSCTLRVTWVSTHEQRADFASRDTGPNEDVARSKPKGHVRGAFEPADDPFPASGCPWRYAQVGARCDDDSMAPDASNDGDEA
jgi:hypothetical protein